MSRNPSPAQLLVALSALVIIGLAVTVIPSDDPTTDALATTASEVNLLAPQAAAAGTLEAAPPGAGSNDQVLRLPQPSDTAAANPIAGAAEPVADDTAAAADTGSDTEANAAAESESEQAAAPAAQEQPAQNPAPAENPAPAQDPAPMQPEQPANRAPEVDDPGEVKGYDVHTFTDHVNQLLGNQMMAPSQEATGGFQRTGPYEIRAQSTITGLQPVIQQAITDIKERNPNASGEKLERKIAKRLTELNDWKNLNDETQETMMILSGVDIDDLNKRVREDTVNHLQHSPLPFGDIDEVLSPDTTIDLGYTHTLDKDWTQVAHLGDGVFQVWMVSNNNNGSHTGHEMGSFKVQLTPTTSLREARKIGNEMVQNKNNNNKLYLAESARKILYGETPWLDYSQLTDEQKLALYDGKGLGEARRALPNLPGAEEPPAEDPPAEDPPAEDPPAEDPPAEDPPAEDPPAEDPPAEDPPAEDPPAEDPPAEDPPAEDPPAEDPPAEDPPAEDPPPDDGGGGG